MVYHGQAGGVGLSAHVAGAVGRPQAPGASGRGVSGALRWFALATVILMYAVVVLGFLDTATGSAFGCGRSFPLCDGRFFPQPTLTSVVEWTHRVVSAFGGLVVLALAIWAWIEARASLHARVLAAIGLGFLVIESVVGALAVVMPEPVPLIALHLGIALTSFGAIAALAFVLWALPQVPGSGRWAADPGVRAYIWGTLVWSYAVIYLGALVAQVGAGPACGGWPLCQGGLVPTHWSWPVLLDYVHRLVAIATLFVFWGMTRVLRRVRDRARGLYRAGHVAFGLVFLTALSGGYLTLSHLALQATLVHVGLITLLFGTVAYLCTFATPSPRPVAASDLTAAAR